MTGWEDFAVAQVGGSAALAGLIFVAVSLNLRKILSEDLLPRRAAEALIVLTTILFSSTLLLAPQQPTNFLGLELLGIGLVSWIWTTTLEIRSMGQGDFAAHPVGSLLGVALLQLALIPFMIAGVAVLWQGTDGLYWLLPGVLFCYGAALGNSWVLLVEINR